MLDKRAPRQLAGDRGRRHGFRGLSEAASKGRRGFLPVPVAWAL